MAGQWMWMASVESVFGRQEDLIPPGGLGARSDSRSLEQLLRVYAPDFHDFLVVFSRRKEQLDTMVVELERRAAYEGREAIEDYLTQLDRTAEALEEARRRVAEFITETFPLRAAE
jgi:hypothetical protein